jgi:hypothetical protein
MHKHTHTHTVLEFAEESSSYRLLYNIFQAKSGNQWAVTYITRKTQNSDRSVHQPTGKNNGDPLAEKAATASDDDMDITQCMPLGIITSNISTSEMGREANGYSIHKSVMCKKQPEAGDIYPTNEVLVLKHKKKRRIKGNGDSSDESVLDEEWKPNNNKMKGNNQRKTRSAKMKCKNLSRTKTGSTTVTKESPITRYRNICMLYIKSIQFALNVGCVLYFTIKSSCVVSKKIKFFQFLQNEF